MLIRLATTDDCPPLVAMIQHTIWVSNTPDYGPDNTKRVMSHFTLDGMAEMIKRCKTFVAADSHHLMGTASIGPGTTDPGIALRTFMVDPGCQRRGIGRALMAEILNDAAQRGLAQLPVRSSIHAEPFYAAHGFAKIDDVWDGDERTIQMVKVL